MIASTKTTKEKEVYLKDRASFNACEEMRISRDKMLLVTIPVATIDNIGASLVVEKCTIGLTFIHLLSGETICKI